MPAAPVFWSNEDVKALIVVWKDTKIQEQISSGKKRNSHVYRKISEILKEKYGVEKDEKAVKNKLKNLKSQYNRIKDNNNRSGRAKKTMEHFEELDEVLGTRPAVRPINLMDSQSDIIESDSEDLDGNNSETQSMGPCTSSSCSERATPPPPSSEIDTPPSSERDTPPSSERATPPPPLKKRRTESNDLTGDESEEDCETVSVKVTEQKNMVMRKGTKENKKLNKMDKMKQYMGDFMTAMTEQRKHETEAFIQLERERMKQEEQMELRRMTESQAHELRMAELLATCFSRNPQLSTLAASQPTYNSQIPAYSQAIPMGQQSNTISEPFMYNAHTPFVHEPTTPVSNKISFLQMLNHDHN